MRPVKSISKRLFLDNTIVNEQLLPLRTSADHVRTGKVKALSLVERALGRAEALTDSNIFTAIDTENALRRAREIDSGIAQGKSGGRLAGVPVVVKDSIDTKDLLTSGGSSAFAGWKPATDSPLVAALREEGAIILGKTNMHELAYGVTSNNPVYGPVRNPYDPTRIAGGSSGGTAAAIAGRIVAGGLGTDTGGSCRMPASLSGCVGFRPSDGRYSGEGIIPLSWTRDAPGPLGLTVDDVVLLDQVCARVPARSTGIRSLSGVRIGLPRDHFMDNLDPDVRTIFEETADRLRRAGAVIVDANFSGLAAQLEKTRCIVRFEAVRALSGYMFAHGMRRNINEVVDAIKGNFEREFIASGFTTDKVDAFDYLTALIQHRPALQAMYAKYFADNDLTGFIVPATIRPASAIGEDDFTEVDGRRRPVFTTFTHNTGPSSAAGVPCLTMPIGMSRTGLPIAMDVVGPSNTDGDVFALATLCEQSLPTIPPPPR
jgi:indoleacetamide hydrolase